VAPSNLDIGHELTRARCRRCRGEDGNAFTLREWWGTVSLMALVERCEAVVRYIAEAGRKFEPENSFWIACLNFCLLRRLQNPASFPIRRALLHDRVYTGWNRDCDSMDTSDCTTAWPWIELREAFEGAKPRVREFARRGGLAT